MTAKRALGLLVALFALMVAPTATLAQGTGGDAAATTAEPAATDSASPPQTATDANGKPELPWLKFCGKLEDGRQLCIVRQLVYAQGQLIARFILRNNPAEDSPLLLLASMPNGVTLPFGLRLQIDNGRELMLPYLQCDAAMCNVRTVVDEAFVNSLKRGGVLKLMAKNARGNDLTVEIDLKGFTAVYDGDQFVSLDNEQAKDQNAADALGQAVQDLAEQIRREKEGANTPADQTATPDQPPASGQ